MVHAIPLHPLPGAIVSSIVVSILGSYANLLLLGRRTSSHGWRNHLRLFNAALCFSTVAVWGMHFVSMVTIRLLASPEVTWYISVSDLHRPADKQFSKGMNSMSLFVPLIATTFAFWFLGSDVDFKKWRVVASGIFVGLTSKLSPSVRADVSRSHALLRLLPSAPPRRVV